MNELHLFAGIGGGVLGGLLLGHRCIGAVEIDPYCRSVLEARQLEGCLPPFPIFDDVRAFDGTAWSGKVDVLCGGFPCQPWSQAGKRKGAADPRHLWPEMARIVSECRPRFVFAENVSMAAFEQPWRDLRGMGYRVPPALCLGASHVGAPHRRLRWWMLAADAEHQPLRNKTSKDVEPGEPVRAMPRSDGGNGHVADASSGRLERRSHSNGLHRISSGERTSEPVRAGSGVAALGSSNLARLAQRQGECGNDGEELAPVVRAGWWATEPRVGRVAHGIPARVAQLKALGNAQVPQVAAEAFAWLMRTHYGEVRS